MTESEINNNSKNLDANRTNDRGLDNAQQDQGKVGAAASNLKTSGPAENLREAAAKAEDKTEDSREPA